MRMYGSGKANLGSLNTFGIRGKISKKEDTSITKGYNDNENDLKY